MLPMLVAATLSQWAGSGSVSGVPVLLGRDTVVLRFAVPDSGRDEVVLGDSAVPASRESRFDTLLGPVRLRREGASWHVASASGFRYGRRGLYPHVTWLVAGDTSFPGPHPIPPNTDFDFWARHWRKMAAPARCGWLECGVFPSTSRGPWSYRTAWLHAPGAADTMHLLESQGRIDSLRIPAPSDLRAGIDLGWGWSARADSLNLVAVHRFGTDVTTFLPRARDFRWNLDGVSWTTPSGAPLQRVQFPSPDLAAVEEWNTDVRALTGRDTLTLARSIRAVWTNSVQWNGPDTLVALARIVSGPASPVPWDRLPLLEVPLLRNRSADPVPGDPAMFRTTEQGTFRSRPGRALPLGNGILADSGSGPGFEVSGDRDGMSVAPYRGERLRASGNALLEQVLASGLDPTVDPGPLQVSGADGIRELASLRLLPRYELRLLPSSAAARREKGGVRFAVDDVQPNRTRLPRMTVARWKKLSRPDPEARWMAGETGSGLLVESEEGYDLLAAAIEAWNHHRPLRISPDAVWMALLSNLTLRASKFPEVCRGDLVSHQGKEDIVVEISPETSWSLDRPGSWRTISDLLLDSLHRRVKGGLDRRFAPRFSTTTPVRALSTRLRVLELYSHYFDFSAAVGCGIPWIRLEGTAADWRLLRERVLALGVCGLGPWSRKAAPVLTEFVNAAEGKPNRGFWKRLVRYVPPNGECGSTPVADGHLVDLLPVGRNGEIRPWGEALDLAESRPATGNFPFRVVNLDQSQRHFRISSGFSGIGQDPDGAVFAELGWSAWEVEADPTEESSGSD